MKIQKKITCFAGFLAVAMGCFDTAYGQANALVVQPSSLTFSTQQGFSPAPQSVTVTTTGGGLGFTVTSGGGANCSLNFQATSSIASAASPATVQVSPQAASLPAGTYNCTATFAATGVNPVILPVTINVSTGSTSGQLSASPTTLSFSSATGTTPTAIQNVTLTNTSSTSVGYNATVNSTPAGWLQINPYFGTVAASSSSQIQVQANPTGLAAGTYNGTISILANGSTTAILVNVSFVVTGSPTLVVTQNGSAVTGVSFAYQTTTSLPPLQTITLSNSSSGSLACTVSANGGSSFLVISPTGSVTVNGTGNPGTNIALSIASSAASLTAGTYTAGVAINCPGASNPTVNIPVSFLVSSTPLLQIVGNLPGPFNLTLGGGNPTNQTVQVASSSTALPFTVTSNQSWLLVSPPSGQASAASPATIVLQVNPSGLPAGTYTGLVTIASPAAGNSQIQFPVTLNISSSTLLNVNPASLTYTYQIAQATPAAQTVTVSSSAGSLTYTSALAFQNCPNFFSVSSSTGTAGPTGSQFQVFVNPSGVPAATVCTGTITITAPGAQNTATVNVTMEVSSSAILQVNQSAIALTGQIGGSRVSTTLTMTSSDSVTLLQYAIFNSAPWLSVTPNSGTTPNNITITADPTALGLVVGDNKTTLTVTSPSLPVPISIPVTLTLTSAATITASPTALTFSQATGGPVPATQAVTLTLAGGSSSNTFTAVAASSFNWLTVTSSGSTFPGTLTVSVNGATLLPGNYGGTITVTAPGVSNSPITINVTLTVTQAQALSVTPSTLTFNSQFGATSNPASQTVQLSSTGGPVSFSVATASSNCNNFITASPQTGSTPASGALNLTIGVNVAGLPAGTCNGSVTISGNGVSPQSVAVALVIAAPPPAQLTSIVNGASFVPSAIAPGEIVTLFGNNIGPVTLTVGNLTSNNTYATKVADTEVLFDGIPAPIIFVRADQVAVVVPFGVGGRFQTNIQVRRSTGLSPGVSQRVVDTAPGIFTSPSGGSGQGAILNQNGSVNGPSAAAPKSSVIAIYMTGAGDMTPGGTDGGLGGTNPLQIVRADVSVTIGGQPATVQFKGAAPGYIQGLYQINVTVPPGAGSGPQAVVVTVGGNQSQGGVTMYVQ